MLTLAASFAGSDLHAWVSNGAQVIPSPSNQAQGGLGDGSGGAFFVTLDPSVRLADGTISDHSRVVRWTGDGMPAVGWPSGGVSLGSATSNYNIVVDACRNGDGSVTAVLASRSLDTFWLATVSAAGTPAPVTLVASVSSVAARAAHIIPRAGGGWIITWQARATPTRSDDDLFMQMLKSDGSPEIGWPVGGRPIASPLSEDQCFATFAGNADTSYVWYYSGSGPGSGSAYISRVTPNGQFDLGWAGGGIALTPPPSSPYTSWLVRADDGGFWLAWPDARNSPDPQFPEPYLDLYLTRITNRGEYAAGWSAAGRLICGAPGTQWQPKMVTDGRNGLFLTWGDSGDLGNGIHAVHLQESGDVFPGWTSSGRRLFGAVGYQDYPQIMADGLGGAFVAAPVFNGGAGVLSSLPHVLVQHFTAWGLLDAPWDSLGYRVNTFDTDQDNPKLIPSEPGAAILLWQDGVDAKATKVSVGGVVATQLALTSSDAALDHVALTWTASGDRVGIATIERRVSSGDWVVLATIGPDGQGRLSYTDRAITPGNSYYYRLSWLAGSVTLHSQQVAILVPLPYRFALAGGRPNPATRRDLNVAFTLAEAGPATLALYDVNGRRVVERALGALGVGEHSLRMSDTPGLSAGIYWVRLTQGAAGATARIAIVE